MFDAVVLCAALGFAFWLGWKARGENERIDGIILSERVNDAAEEGES